MSINNLLKILTFLFILTQLSLFSSSTFSKTNILVLQDFYHLPRTKEFNLGLKDTQEKYKNLVFYMEHMHKSFNAGVITDDEWKKYLLKKYKNIKIDAIISSSPDSSIFLKKYERLFGEIPLVVINQNVSSFSNPVMSFKANLNKAIKETVKIALEQNPSTKKTILITNNKGAVSFKLNKLLKEKNINLEILNVESIQNIIQNISVIDKETIVFYEPVFKDMKGVNIIPRELLKSLTKSSPAPIYTFWSPLMNTGVIGGFVIDTRTLSSQMVESIMYYQKNNSFPDKYNTLKVYLDWKAMKKFSIGLSDIKEGSKILNKPKSFFEIHYKEISTAFAIIISLFIFTIYWVIKLRKLNKEIQSKSLEIIKLNENLEQFIDTQNNIVILSNGKEIKFVNKKFCDFFGFNTLEDFTKKYNSICELFLKNDRFFYLKIKNGNWIEEITELPYIQRIVSIKGNDSQNYVFSVSINKFDNELKIISFTDISETVNENIKLEKKIIKDKLTNAYNREYFEKNQEKLIKKYSNDKSFIALAFLDIDHFKLVNDNHGHDIGDKVLKHFVKTIDKYSRENDTLIRWGGEEFILILEIKSKENLFKVLEHIRKVIELEVFPVIGHLTSSIGASIYKEKEDIYKTIKRADICLYKAKNNGRNNIVISKA